MSNLRKYEVNIAPPIKKSHRSKTLLGTEGQHRSACVKAVGTAGIGGLTTREGKHYSAWQII